MKEVLRGISVNHEVFDKILRVSAMISHHKPKVARIFKTILQAG